MPFAIGAPNCGVKRDANAILFQLLGRNERKQMQRQESTSPPPSSICHSRVPSGVLCDTAGTIKGPTTGDGSTFGGGRRR